MLFYIILAIIEGITELLPVSSTAHMLLWYTIMERHIIEFDRMFIISIQAFASLGILAKYYRLLYRKKGLIVHIFITTFVTSVVALFLRYVLGVNFDNVALTLIGGNLLWGGVVFLLLAYRRDGILTDLNKHHAIIIGIIQGLAILPGISRSGAVVLGMLLLGYRFRYALEYSFLTAIPTLGAAAAYEVFDLYLDYRHIAFPMVSWISLLISGFTSAIIVYILVNVLQKLTREQWLKWFGWYRVFLGALLLVSRQIF